MLVVFGVASLVVCALLVVLGRAAFTNPARSQAVRNFVTSASYHVFLATFAGVGVVMLLLSVTTSSSLGGMEIGLSAGIAVAGIFGVRLLNRADDEAAA